MASARELLSPSPSQSRILVCDDAASLRALMAAVLGRSYSVLLTATAEEALARAPAFAPDLLITDHILPGMSGRDLVARLRAIPAFEDLPIVMLTAVSDADSRAEGIEAGADEYLVKPVRERELLARVASLLRLRSTLLALSRRSRELEDANVALREARDRAVRSERLAALGAMAASLAHDINNPLSTVVSGATTLRDIVDEAACRPAPLEPDRFARLMHELMAISTEIVASSRRLQEIGQDLRLFGSRDPATSDRIPVADAARSAVSLACARAPHPPRVELNVAGHPELEAPPHLVTLVLLSIIDRAVTSAGAHGHVKIDVRPIGEDVEIAVRDDGDPIPIELLPRVFEPFAPRHPAHLAAGLGLAVAAGIVQGLGGHIDVDGRMEHGACFRVRLPLAHRAVDG